MYAPRDDDWEKETHHRDDEKLEDAFELEGVVVAVVDWWLTMMTRRTGGVAVATTMRRPPRRPREEAP